MSLKPAFVCLFALISCGHQQQEATSETDSGRPRPLRILPTPEMRQSRESVRAIARTNIHLKRFRQRSAQLKEQFHDLLQMMPVQLHSPNIHLKLGQIVRHSRYDYRGVIVEIDPTCKADDNWIRNNGNSGHRDEPWAYVLVHGTTHVTYAPLRVLIAETRDHNGGADLDAVNHPFVPHFFRDFKNGTYERNDRPWPRT